MKNSVIYLFCIVILSGCQTTDPEKSIANYSTTKYQVPPDISFIERRISDRCKVYFNSNLYLEVGDSKKAQLASKFVEGEIINVNTYCLELRVESNRVQIIPLENIKYIEFYE